MGRKKKVKVRKQRAKIEHEWKVPKEVFDEGMSQIDINKNYYNGIQTLHFDPHIKVYYQKFCHDNSTKSNPFKVSDRDGLHQRANFYIAARQALEMRDFKALYRIVIKGFELNNKFLNRFLFQYLYTAIENDPLINERDREQMLLEAVRGCKIIYKGKSSAMHEFESEEDALKYIRNYHSFIKRINYGHESEDEDLMEVTVNESIEK